jgi:hypothetical protein
MINATRVSIWFAILLLFPKFVLAQCADVRSAFNASGGTINGQRVADKSVSDLTGIVINQTGCDVTATFYDRPACGIKHEMAANLQDRKMVITRAGVTIMYGTINLTKTSLSWHIDHTNGVGMSSTYAESRTFVYVDGTAFNATANQCS